MHASRSTMNVLGIHWVVNRMVVLMSGLVRPLRSLLIMSSSVSAHALDQPPTGVSMVMEVPVGLRVLFLFLNLDVRAICIPMSIAAMPSLCYLYMQLMVRIRLMDQCLTPQEHEHVCRQDAGMAQTWRIRLLAVTYQMTQFVLMITNMAVLNVVARSRRPMLQFVLMIMAMRLTLTIRSLTAVPGSPSCFWCRAWGMDAPRRRGGTVSGMVVVLKYVNKVAVPQVARSGMTMIQYVLKITTQAVLKVVRSHKTM